MSGRSNRSRNHGLVALWGVLALLALLAIPATSGAGLIGETVDGVADAVDPEPPASEPAPEEEPSGSVGPTTGVAGDPAPAEPSAGDPGNYEPPLHGANPHGQGDVAVVDLTPSQDVPLSGDPSGVESGEDVVVGRSRGERSGGAYHGHVTIASVAPLGIELAVDTNEGETQAGPLDAIQTGLLDALCDGTGNQVCLEVLRADSTTTSTGSTNSFAVANAQIGGANGIGATAAESNGNISTTNTCQSSSGNSTVTNASIGGALTADVIESTSSSSACSSGSQSVEQTSRVVNLSGNGLPITNAGCADGTPDSTGGIQVPGIADFVCNADDTNGVGEPFGAQTTTPYGVREGLTVFVLAALGTELAKATTAASESHAVAPRRGGARRWAAAVAAVEAAVVAVAVAAAAVAAAETTAATTPTATASPATVKATVTVTEGRTPARPSPAPRPTTAAPSAATVTSTATASRTALTHVRPFRARHRTTAVPSAAVASAMVPARPARATATVTAFPMRATPIRATVVRMCPVRSRTTAAPSATASWPSRVATSGPCY